MKKYVLLSFDVEEFDMPLEYNQKIDLDEQMDVGIKGLDVLMPILSQTELPTTLFTTANFALRYPDRMKELSSIHEIASHTFYHSSFEDKDLLESKEILEKITDKKVVGLRMPRMRTVDLNEVKLAGYQYDSSINPTLIPGRYNNLHLSRTVYSENNLTRIPASVSPKLRLPLFWLGFKNYPYSLFRNLCIKTLHADGYLCLYLHPWEFTDLKKYKLPWYAKRIDNSILTTRLNRLINDLGNHADFTTIENYLSLNKLI
jgi:hypothetical protein